MVKRKILILGVLFSLLGGCNQANAPMHALMTNSLLLSVPPPVSGVSAKFTLNPILEYRISSGNDLIKGSVDYLTLQNLAGPVNISLPHGGEWFVSAEWLNQGVTLTRMYIGADWVDIEGATHFDLKMGTLNNNCYKITLADTLSTSGFADLFTFNTYVTGFSVNGDPGMVQCLLNAAPSLFLQDYPVPAAHFTYLGNGLWVDYTQIPADAVFYNNTLAAKQAVEGAAAVLADGDVYVMKLSGGGFAWIQIGTVNNVPTNTSADLYFRVNRGSESYLKFDVTAYGDVNCNTSGVTLY